MYLAFLMQKKGYRPLKSGFSDGLRGVFVVSTPYHGYLKNLLIALFNKWDSHHFSLIEGAHIKFFSKKTLKLILERNGFSLQSVVGVGRIPFLWRTMVAVAVKTRDVNETERI